MSDEQKRCELPGIKKMWLIPEDCIVNDEISLEKIQQAEREGKLVEVPITQGKTTLTWISDKNPRDGACDMSVEHQRSFTIDLSKPPSDEEKSFWKKLFGE